jgi:hypothetical protein
MNDYSRSLDIVHEPRGAVYRQLLAFAVERCARFSLVWRDPSVPYGPQAAAVERALRPFYLQETYADQWPGTRLLGATARVVTYSLNESSAAGLARADRLYAWRHPHCPEDLATYTCDGLCWLGSIAHERDAFLNAEVVSLEEVRQRVPGLRVQLRVIAP